MIFNISNNFVEIVRPVHGPVCYGEGVLGAAAQRAARSLTVAMKYAPLVLVMRCSRLAWGVSAIAIQRSPSGCSRMTFW